MSQKNIFLIIFFLAILFFVVYGFLISIPGIEETDGDFGKIEIQPAYFDFGDANYGDILEYGFEIENKGRGALRIDRVATSCACTSAKISKSIIYPGDKVELLVIYNTGLMTGDHAKGDQERTIYIRSNDPVSPQAEAKIHARVK